jgi:hypothetical protein
MKNKQPQLSDLDYRINRARLSGAMRSYTQTEFKNYLLDIGLNRYEKNILPIETEGEYSGAMAGQPQEKDRTAQLEIRLQAAGCETAPEAIQRTETKIIPFPGVTLATPEDDIFQNGLNDFLREMGYVE